MEVTGLHDLLPDRLSGSSFKEDIIRKDDGCLPTGLEDSMNVLQEVELLVTGRDPEVLPVIGQVVLLCFPSSFVKVMELFFPNGGFVRT